MRRRRKRGLKIIIVNSRNIDNDFSRRAFAKTNLLLGVIPNYIPFEPVLVVSGGGKNQYTTIIQMFRSEQWFVTDRAHTRVYPDVFYASPREKRNGDWIQVRLEGYGYEYTDPWNDNPDRYKERYVSIILPCNYPDKNWRRRQRR